MQLYLNLEHGWKYLTKPYGKKVCLVSIVA
jgi:hypothetical protein